MGTLTKLGIVSCLECRPRNNFYVKKKGWTDVQNEICFRVFALWIFFSILAVRYRQGAVASQKPRENLEQVGDQ